jgi:cytochrome c oxidase cbb3-type subunit 2
MAISWLAFIFEPQMQIGTLQQTNNIATVGVLYPNTPAGDAQQGAEIYRANGCAACHTQQVRPDADGRDLSRGWGHRRSVAEDYLYAQPAMLGSQRVGPDLANVGMRVDAASVLVRLYNPRAIPGNGSSVMPPYPFLFETRKIGETPSADALLLPPEYAPKPGYEIVPGPKARALAAYLVNLRQDAYLYDVPPPATSTNAAGTNAVAGNAKASASMPSASTNAPAK